jgi:CRISPR-associated protein Csb1
MKEFRDGVPNPDRRVLGGVLTSKPIDREVTINLVALRRISGRNSEMAQKIRRYLLSLALIAATVEFELYLREGCNLRLVDEGSWEEVPRRGQTRPIDLASSTAQDMLLEYAEAAARVLRPEWPQDLVHKFDLNEAKRLLAKKTEDEPEAG